MSSNQMRKTVVPLRGGLSLTSPRYSVTPGTLQDGQNYETYAVAGYKVADGILRYDGTYPCFLRDWVVATRSFGTGNFNPGEYLKIGTNFFGQCVAWDTTNSILSYVILNQQFAPKISTTITGATTGSTLIAATGGIKKASLYYTDEASFLAAQKANYELARNAKKSIYPYISYAKNTIPHGLHWYKGQLYAIVDNYQVTFNTGITQPLPGDQITVAGVVVATILSVGTVTGSWGSNATGTLVIRTDTAGGFNSITAGSQNIRRPSGATAFTTYTAAFNITDVQTPSSPSAGMFSAPYDDDYQTTAQINASSIRFSKRWNPVDMGWEIPFITNTTTMGNAPTPIFRGTLASDIVSGAASIITRATSETLDGTASQLHPFAGTSFTQAANTPLHTVLGDASTASYATVGTFSGPSNVTGATASLIGFNAALAALPSSAIITGISVTATASSGGNTSGTVNLGLVGATIGAPTSKAVAVPAAANHAVTTVGADGDLWGSTIATANLLTAVRDDPTFGVSIQIVQNVAAATENLKLEEISMTVYYKTPVTAYYAHDPVSGQDLQVSIPYYQLASGTFNPGAVAANFGVGSMSLYNITPQDSTTGSTVPSNTFTVGTGWQLRDAQNGTGNLIALFSGQMAAAVLPNRASMESVQKRFEIISANYYANTDWEAFYGVSGVGPSFQYDGYYFYNVYTQLPRAQDTPSHIAYHRNYSALGFSNGQIILSVPGAPTDFNGADGSVLYPFGNRITGLLSLNGTALGVFCESAIYALTGDILGAFDGNNAVSQLIAPYSGAIEYTVRDCGTPLFADFRGISTIDATNKYGDFENGRVSFDITPFLMDRVNDRFAFQATSQNILFAIPVRNKNQYRLYFADGQILTCGLPIGDRGYEFTKQKYTDSNNLDTMVPVAMCSGTTKAGRDLLFGTFQLRPFDETNIATPSAPERECYVYAMDKGTRFDLAPIKYFAQLNYMPVDDPNTEATVRKLRIEMLTYHTVDNAYVAATSDYQDINHVERPFGINPTGLSVRTAPDSDYVVVSTEAIGTTVAIEIGGESIYPGHVLQALVVYDMPGREQLGNSPTQALL